MRKNEIGKNLLKYLALGGILTFAMLSSVSGPKIAKNIFKSEWVGLLATFLLSSSLFHILMSANGRHWLPVSFFTILVLWLLNLDWEFQKRYLAAVLAVGVGMGVSPINVLLVALIGYWYFFYEQRTLPDLLKEKYFYLSLAVLALLAILPGILYPQSFGFRNDVTSQEAKSISGIIMSPFLFLKPVALSEPVLAFFAVLGLLFSFFYRRNLFWPISLFLYTYSAIFYLFFRYEHRFTLPLFPLIAIMAAYGGGEVYKRINNRFLLIILMIVLIIPAVFSVRLSYLLYQNDSRIHLIEWVESNFLPDSKILVYARLMRLPATPEAIKEQRTIDIGSLRRVDLAEENLPKQLSFHALNLYTIQNEKFYSNLKNYSNEHQYQYVLTSLIDFEKNPGHFSMVQNIASRGVLLKSFGEFQENYSPYIGQLFGNPLVLFKLKEFGPPVAIYKLSL